MPVATFRTRFDGRIGRQIASICGVTDASRKAPLDDEAARAALAPHIVELNESAMDAMGSSAVALEHLAPQSLALSHPAIALETPPLEKNQSAAAEQTRKGLTNLLRHLKMSSGAVSWQNGAKRHTVESLPAGFFQSGSDPVQK